MRIPSGAGTSPEQKLVMRELLKSRNVPDIESIPISSYYHVNKSKNLTQEQIENTISPGVISPLQQELKSWYDRLLYLRPKYMFRQENLVSSQSYFWTLRMMCLFVHHACLETPGVNNGLQNRRNQGLYVSTLKINQDTESQLIRFSEIIMN